MKLGFNCDKIDTGDYMLDKIHDFIVKNNLIEDDVVVCAVSGGADSVALLHILYSLGYKVVLAHVNHNMREQSKIEQRAMESLASKLNIPFELFDYHFDNSGNFQAVAHEARYKFFKSVCDKYNTKTIATAHHASDQIETVLMRILEGSNLFGYGGISLCGNVEGYRIIRPLLIVDKDDLYSYNNQNKLEYFEDSSNQTDHYLRNRLRHHVVPYLKDNCPDLNAKINNYSTQVKEAFSFIRELSINYLKKWNNRIVVGEFNILNIALKKDIISLVLEQNDINRNVRIIDNILELLQDTRGTKEISLSNSSKLVRSYNEAFIVKNRDNIENKVLLNLNDKVKFGKYLFYFSKSMPQNNEKFIKLCYNSLELPLVIRSREESDEIKLEFGTKKVSRVLIDCKVSKENRPNIPLIFNGNGDLLWIYDYKKSKLVSLSKGDGDLYLICEVNTNE